FLAGFVSNISRYATHVRSHPPGFLLLVWALTRIGVDGAVAAMSLALAGAAAAGVAALVALRELGGESAARRAAPFLVVVPAAVWMLGSADALFACVGATGVALFALATGRRGRDGDAAALGAGLLFGAGLFLSYGLVLLLALPVAIAVARR